MCVDEDTELRDLVVHSLEANGVLSKIKAELRASVFLALEGDGTFKNNSSLTNVKLNQFLSSPDGKKTVSLIREFLEFFGLSFTLSVFDPEVSEKSLLSRNELCSEFQIPPDTECPVISKIVSSFQNFNKQSCKGGNEGLLVTDDEATKYTASEAAVHDVSAVNRTKARDALNAYTIPQTNLSSSANPSVQSLETSKGNFTSVDGTKLVSSTENAGMKNSDVYSDSILDKLLSNHPKSKNKKHLDPIKNSSEEATSAETGWQKQDVETASFSVTGDDKLKKGRYHQGTSSSYDKPKSSSYTLGTETSDPFNKDGKNHEASSLSHNSKQGQPFDNLRDAANSIFPDELDDPFAKGSSKPKPEDLFGKSKSQVEPPFPGWPAGYDPVAAFSRKAESIKNQSLSSLRDLPDLDIGFKKPEKVKPPLTYSTSKSDGEEAEKSDCSTKSSHKSNASTKIRYDGESYENSEASIEEEVEDDVSAGVDDLLSSISIGEDSTSDVTLSQKSSAGGYDYIEHVLPK